MRKLLLFTTMLLAGMNLFAQVQRNVVIQEIGTGTWCTYCPGAANGAQQLLSSGANVAVIEYHNGDAFTNTASDARNSYYNITGYPTAHFDGTGEHLGGASCPSGNVYADYLPLYNAAYAVQSPLVIDISGTNSGNVYNIVLSIKKVGTISGSDLRAHLVLTETDIATSPWPSAGCMTAVHDVERLMCPDQNGTTMSFTSGDMQIITLQFTKDASWVTAKCELVAFVQDNGTKTIYNGSKVALSALPAPIPVDFTGSPLSGCAPVNVSFTDQSVGVTNWQWSFPGGSPSSSTVQNPSVSYNTAGSFDVTLTAWSNTTNRGNKVVKPGYATPNAIPVQPSQPLGNNAYCIDPPTDTYSVPAVPNTTTYTWDLQPTNAGVMTPAGTSCTIDWSSTFTGTAALKVRGSNACGAGTWSTPLNITISNPPGVPGTPTGPTQLCMNSANTDYVTTGTTPATSYFWELLPSTAGTATGASNSCTINWADTWTGTATLKVKAINSGCEGPWSANLNITIEAGPVAYNITGGGTYCAIGGAGIPVGVSNSQTGINYTLYKDGTATTAVLPGTGSAISFGNQTDAGTYTVVGASSLSNCTNNMTGSAVVAVDPQAPAAPGTPQGPAMPNAGTSTDYNTTGGQYATSYSWEVSPANAGTFNGSTTTGSITWNAGYSGPAEITVTGVNTCGNGTTSTAYAVTVLPVNGTGDINAAKFATWTPNPAKGKIVLKAENGIYKLVVKDAAGREMFSKNNLSGNETIDISGLKTGMYFFSLDNGKTIQVSKIIINE
ncbi:MAG: T9SS type A sorting domain-containing protein [Syntrophothermus sp.]